MHVVPERQPRAAGPFLPVGKQPAVGEQQIDARQPEALQAGGQAALDQAGRSAPTAGRSSGTLVEIRTPAGSDPPNAAPTARSAPPSP